MELWRQYPAFTLNDYDDLLQYRLVIAIILWWPSLHEEKREFKAIRVS